MLTESSWLHRLSEHPVFCWTQMHLVFPGRFYSWSQEWRGKCMLPCQRIWPKTQGNSIAASQAVWVKQKKWNYWFHNDQVYNKCCEQSWNIECLYLVWQWIKYFFISRWIWLPILCVQRKQKQIVFVSLSEKSNIQTPLCINWKKRNIFYCPKELGHWRISAFTSMHCWGKRILNAL